MTELNQTLYEAEVSRLWAGQGDGAHDLWHLRRVWAMCQRIAAQDGLRADMVVLEAAAFFHDAVNLPKDDRKRGQAAQMSADHADLFLKRHGMGSVQRAGVRHAIAGHSFSANLACETLEARVLQDADRLEALGALGIARCFNVSGQMGAALFDGADPMAQARVLEDRRFALDHFRTKLYPIANSLHTEAARAIAATRVAFMKEFVDQLLREIA